MKRCATRSRWIVATYVGLSASLYVVPLTRVLHAESSAIISTVAFFVAGVFSLSQFERRTPFFSVLRWQLTALIVPWFLLTLSLLWTPNCGYGQGLLLFIIFAPVSVALAVSLAYALAGSRLRHKKTTYVVIGVLIVLVGTLYDLGWHPQFYVYNHVFGGVLGPVYDEVLTLRPGLFAFRGLTLLWTFFLWQLGRWLRLRIGGRGLVATACVLVLCYVFSTTLGLNTTGRHIQRTLGGHYPTAHFDIYYHPASLSNQEVQRIAEDHEYRYAQMAEQLDMEVHGRISSYLYPDPSTKGRLTGARTTSVAPTWLRHPQIHLLTSSYQWSFAHELAHVFSRDFGLPFLRASWSAGLVEGLAVALEPPDGLPTPHEQVAAQTVLFQKELAGSLSQRLSPIGFWTGRGAVSYTMMGSFIRYLLDTYGAERLRRVYALANFEHVYGKPVHVLASEWEHHILHLPAMDRATGDWVFGRFRTPSLFEKPCPHHVPDYVHYRRDAARALLLQDTTAAEAYLAKTLRLKPAYEPALSMWARLAVATGHPELVVSRLDTVESERMTAALTMYLGDAYVALNRIQEAHTLYTTALDQLPDYMHETRSLLLLRRGSQATPQAQSLLDAWHVAGSGDYEQAANLLRSTGAQDFLPVQRLAWLARWTYYAGDTVEAARHARNASRLYYETGAVNLAALYEDFAGKMEWLQWE